MCMLFIALKVIFPSEFLSSLFTASMHLDKPASSWYFEIPLEFEDSKVGRFL